LRKCCGARSVFNGRSALKQTMPGIESYGPGKPKSDSATRSYSEPIVFTDEEHAAIEQNLDRYRSLMRGEASEGGKWAVPTRIKDAMAAQGLYYYAEDLLTVFGFDKASDEQTANQLHKAMIAKMKCLKMFPLPILMYEVGVLLDALGTPEALTMFRSFLDAQSQFVPGEFDKLLLDTIKSDIAAATADARKRLSLVQDVSVNPSEPQSKPQQVPPWPKNLDPSTSEWLSKHSVSDPTIVTPLTFPRRDRSERKSPQEIVQKGLPEEKLEAFLKLARHLIREGVDTPEKMALIVPENARGYAQALWDSLAIVNPKLRGTHDWQQIFASAP
jgi:hypothetical protein